MNPLKGTAPLKNHGVREQIIAFLARHGASKASDISTAVGTSKGTVQYHLKALESASVVRANIPPENRARSTPYYALGLVRIPENGP